MLETLKRSALVSALVVVALAGCSGGGSSKKTSAASTTAPTTSSTAPVTTNTGTVPITSTSKPTSSVKIVSAAVEDKNGNHVADKGDVLTITCDVAVALTATDPVGHLELLAPGDSFGTGAAMAPGLLPTEIVVTLGDAAKLKVTGDYAAQAAGPYQPSGIDFDAKVSGIADAKGVAPTPGNPADLTSTTLKEGCYDAILTLKSARGLHSATLLDDGTILVVGGVARNTAGTFYATENELVDPVLNTSLYLSAAQLGGAKGYMTGVRSTGATFAMGRYAHVAVKLANGKVLIAAGHGYEEWTATSPTYTELKTAFLYDPATKGFTQTGSLAAARRDAQAVLLAGGTKVLVMGGRDAKGVTLSSSEIYDSATGTWSAGPAMAAARADHATVMTPSGTFLIGGISGATLAAADEAYDPALNTFKASAQSAPTRRRNHTAMLMDTGDVLVAGGYGAAALASIERYNALLGQWVAVGNLAAARERHVASRIEGDALAIGGMTIDAGGNVKTVDTVESYDANGAIGSFPLKTARLSHTATLLKDGRVMILGGFSSPVKNKEGLDGLPNAAAEVFIRP